MVKEYTYGWWLDIIDINVIVITLFNKIIIKLELNDIGYWTIFGTYFFYLFEVRKTWTGLAGESMRLKKHQAADHVFFFFAQSFGGLAAFDGLTSGFLLPILCPHTWQTSLNLLSCNKKL